MSEKDPFIGLVVYDACCLDGVFRGYIITDMKKQRFKRIVDQTILEKGDYDIKVITQRVANEGYRAIPMRWSGVIDFKDLSKSMQKNYPPQIIFGNYWVYEIYVDDEPQEQGLLNFRGLLATDCPAKEFHTLMKEYVDKFKSRLHSDIRAYVRGCSYYAEWLNYTPLPLQLKAKKYDVSIRKMKKVKP